MLLLDQSDLDWLRLVEIFDLKLNDRYPGRIADKKAGVMARLELSLRNGGRFSFPGMRLDWDDGDFERTFLLLADVVGHSDGIESELEACANAIEG